MSKNTPPYVPFRKVVSIFDNVTMSVSPPGTNSIEYMKTKLPNLFNLSIDDFVEMSNDKAKLELALKLLNIDENDKVSIKRTKQFIKYIAKIPDAKSKSSRELSALIGIDKNKHHCQLKNLNPELLEHIFEKYKSMAPALCKWIDTKLLNLNGLILNPSQGAIAMLEKYIKDPELAKKYRKNWNDLLKNENSEAIKLLEFLDPLILKTFKWNYLSSNKSNGAIEYLKENPGKIVWEELISNPSAVHFLETIYSNKNHMYDEYHSKISWEYLHLNPHPIAKALFEKYLKDHDMDISDIDTDIRIRYDELHLGGFKKKLQEILANKRELVEAGDIDLIEYEFNPDDDDEEYDPDEEIDEYIDADWQQDEWDNFWDSLSADPKEINLITKILTDDNYKYVKHHINWYYLSENNKAINFLLEHQYKIDWDQLSKNTNPGAIKLLEKNKNKINWYNFSANPSIFMTQ